MSFLDLKGKKVLVIDDFDEMRNLVRGMVEPLRPDIIVTARNGNEAIEQMEKTPFDIVFCDYNLGKGKDGQQILEEARHRSLLPYSTIFMMITAESTSEMVMAAIDYFPDDYISKPFTKTLLLKRLDKICSKKVDLDVISVAFENKDYGRALKLCEHKLNEQPNGQTELLKTKGELLCRLGQLEAAEKFYAGLLEQRDLPWAKLALGEIYFTKKLYFEAEETFESLINDNPANMSAHDSLAKTYEKIGDLRRCQNILNIAVEKSPKSLLRQRKLAEVAFKNSDYEASETAYGRAIAEGKYSCYRNSSDFSGLAKTMLIQDKPDEALQTIEQLNKQFKNTPEAQLHSAATSALIHKQNNNLDTCIEDMEKVFELFKAFPDELDIETALDVTRTSLALNLSEKIEPIVSYLVRNNLNNEKLLEQIVQIYEMYGLKERGEAIIHETKRNVICINNEGAELLKDGKLDESIEFFMKAAKSMPNNSTININAAYSLIMQMQKTGNINRYYSRANKYLERVLKTDPNNQKYHQLMKMVQSLTT